MFLLAQAHSQRSPAWFQWCCHLRYLAHQEAWAEGQAMLMLEVMLKWEQSYTSSWQTLNLCAHVHTVQVFFAIWSLSVWYYDLRRRASNKFCLRGRLLALHVCVFLTAVNCFLFVCFYFASVNEDKSLV